MPFKTRFQAFAAKVETTPGTDANPTMATDAIRLLEPATFEEFYVAENRTDDVNTGSVGVALYAGPSGRAGRITLRYVPIGAGAPYSSSGPLPEADPLLRCAGFNATVTTTTGSEKVTYAAAADPQTTVTALFQVSGKAYKLLHAVTESFRITAEAGSFPIIEQTLVGLFNGPVDAALDPATYDTVEWPLFKGTGSVVIGGATNLVVRSVSVDLGLEVAARTDANATDGHAGYLIMRRVPTITVVGEIGPLSAWNPSADQNARTQRTIDIRFGKGTTDGKYKRLNIVADDARVVQVRDNDLNGLRVYEVTYLCGRPGTGSEFDIVFD